jgi:NAD(P)-dependent dehydrogenase (short-subunit alcohol dehydrogenase family)
MTEGAPAMAFDLSGHRILITGAAGGVGGATARICTRLGAELVLVDLREPAALADELAAGGAKVAVHLCDAGVRAQVEAVAAAAGDVDALVVCAAYCPFDDWMAEDWDEAFSRVMRVNVQGPINFARAYLPRMIARRSGRIVLIGSVAGRMGGLMAAPHYVASKGGVHALVKWLAQRGAPHNVLVNGVAPGPTDTAMIRDQPFDPGRLPIGRLARPEEIAWPIAFLCSPAASFICGAVLDVNGGAYMS